MNRSIYILPCSIAALLVSSGVIFATDNLWTGSVDNDWNKPGNWSLNRVPVSPSAAPEGFDDAVVNTSTGNIATILANTVANPRDVKVGSGTGAVGRVDQRAGTASTGGGNWAFIGLGGGTGTYNLANTATTVATTASGPFTGFAQGSGTFTTLGENLYVGIDAGSVGTLNVNTTGTLQADRVKIGAGGATGTTNVDSGTFASGRSFQVGESGGSLGVVNQSGGLVNVTNDWFGIGYGSGGAQNSRYSITGGELRIGAVAEIGADRGGILDISGTGKVRMVGGGNNNGGFIVGLRTGGNGTVNLSGNGLLELGDTGNFTIGGQTGTTGLVVQTGGSITDTSATATPLIIGRDSGSTGTYRLSGGTATFLADSRVGAGGIGTLEVSGTGALTAKNLNLNGGNGGVVNQSGGTVVANEWVSIGQSVTNSGQYNLSGGTVQAAGFEVGSDGPGTLTMTGGTLNTGNLEVAVRNNGSGVMALSAGTVNATNVLLGGRDAQNVGTVGRINQTGGTMKVSGTLDLQTANAGTGRYDLSGGVLAVDGNIDALTGTFNFTGGKLTRSNAGILTYDGNLTTGSNTATLKLDTDKTFDVNGILNVSTGLRFELTGLTIPAYGGSGIQTGGFLLGMVDGIVGTFDPATTSTPGLINTPGATFISETFGEGGVYNPNTQSVYWIQENAGNVSLRYSVVPEPGTFALLGVSGLAFLVRRRRS